jgi:hypothetical protein
MADRLVQVVRRRAEDRRVRFGEEPVFEFKLAPHERIIGVAHSGWTGGSERKTEDHYIYAWVAVEL